ncbi:MAG: hypothetical protein RL748_2713 [Pseudomonadota bacterium]
MRYTANHKQATRAHLLKVTGSLVKKQGFAATGVDALMAAAGLTSGAFYSHFGSKKALLEAIIENELARSQRFFAANSPEAAMVAVEKYLSLHHINHPETGCPLPTLTSEIARADASTKAAFEAGMGKLQQQIAAVLQDQDKAWAVIATMMGAVSVARGMVSDAARQAVLDGALAQVRGLLGVVNPSLTT